MATNVTNRPPRIEEIEEVAGMDSGLSRRWRSLPGPVRKSVVLTIGLTLFVIGAVLVILPGPFSLPFVIAGLAILSSEFLWAARLMERGQASVVAARKWVGRVPTPALITVGLFVFLAICATAYWWLTRG